MMEVVLAIVVPILLAPLLILALRHLFAWFIKQGIELFLDHDYPAVYSRSLGMSLAQLNVIAGVLIWYAIFGIGLCELPMLGCAAASIFGILLTLWLSIDLVRRRLHVEGWPAMQVGLIGFAGGNVPFFVTVPTMLVLL